MVVCELMISYWIRTQAQWISYLWPKFLLNLACSWYNQYYFTGKSQLQELQNHKARSQKYFEVRVTHANHCKNPESNKAALFSICTDNTEFLIYKQSKDIDECLTKCIMCNPSSLDSILCPIQICRSSQKRTCKDIVWGWNTAWQLKIWQGWSWVRN